MREQLWKIASHMRYESWVERQVREAIERGEFDNLPGQGKPIKGLNGRDDENWWVKSYLEREQLAPSAADITGTPQGGHGAPRDAGRCA